MTRISQPFLILLAGLILSTSAFATTLLPVSLEYLSTKAELIFYGTVISNEVKVDEVSGHVATFTRFEVIELIKGNVDGIHTIKQIGGQLAESNIIHRVHGVPRFTVGKEYVVFMPQQSRLGFASPLGLNQGRFVVSKQNGVSTVKRGRAALAILTTTSNTASAKAAKQTARTSLTEFLQAVRELAAK